MANPRHDAPDLDAIAEAIEKSERRQWRARKDYGSKRQFRADRRWVREMERKRVH